MSIYYVSTTDGNDSYNGLYPTYQSGNDGPWLTVAKVNSSQASFNPGDSILFNKGNVWNTGTGDGLLPSKSGSEAGGYITYGAYGTGERPIIQHDSSVDGVPPIYSWTTGLAYINIENIHAQQTRASGGGSGISFNRTGRNHIKISNCKVSRTGSSSGVGIGIRYVDTYIIEDCIVEPMGSAGILIEGSPAPRATNGTIRRCIVDGNSDSISIHDDAGGSGNNPGDNHLIEDCVIGWTTQPIENCIDMGLNLSDTIPQGIVIRGNSCKGGGAGAMGLNGNGTIVENNFIYYGGNSGWEGLIVGNGGSNFKIRYNVITNGGEASAYGLMLTDASPYNTNVEIYNNVIYNGGNGTRSALVIYPGDTNITVKNNIVINEVSGYQCVHFYNEATPTSTNTTLDYNCYYSSAGDSNQFHANDINYNFANWKSTFSQDANSKFADPLFVNGSGTYSLDTDFQIPSNSPAKNAGTNVGLTEDYFGTTVPQGSAPDIGVHEYAESEPIYLIWTK